MQPEHMTCQTSHAFGPGKGGEGGEGGAVILDLESVTNQDFIAAAFDSLPAGAHAAVCAKPGDPGKGGWPPQKAATGGSRLVASHNNYINCSSFYVGDDGTFKVQQSRFAACHFLLLDDIGTKVELDKLRDFELSWQIESSPGNFQGAILLKDPLTDGNLASRLHGALIDSRFCDPGAKGPMNRWARLPVAINGKPKYLNERGEPFHCRLVKWSPRTRYSPDEIVDRLGLQLSPVAVKKSRSKKLFKAPDYDASTSSDGVLVPRADENPVVAALKSRGLYKTPLGSGKHDLTCPWVHDHTDQIDTGTAYFEPDDQYPLGGFCCQHSHRDKYHIHNLLEYLGVPVAQARHKPIIRVMAGDLHRVVDAAERELAHRGRYYQAGGLIVSVVTDPTTGDPAIVPVSSAALTRELSATASWERYDSRQQDWMRCDPPNRHVGVLYDSQTFRSLPPLAGLARQPYFRETDGELVTQSGYDAATQRFGVFDSRQFALPKPTRQAALESLAIIEELLTEFHFVSGTDKAAALSAIFTAVVRPSLPFAPGFHVRAPVFGSGKTYLCELIGAFAGPGPNCKVSYPTTSEEATKVILSLMMSNPAVIEFDDMDTDWIPHGTIKRIFTAEHITDRILGVSKTATVCTRTLILGSGNNVGPVRDLLRRVLTIHLDPRCSSPATMAYKGFPVDKVRQNRGLYVAAVLTIIEAWRSAGMPWAEVDSIVTFGGAWSDYCRQPLLWLGHPDPAASLIDQVRQDPDSVALQALFVEWYLVFGDSPTTVRKAVDYANMTFDSNLMDAIREFPVTERGAINPSKLGWMLKKNANRIAGGYELQQSTADGRTAWRVLKVTQTTVPSSPPLPPLPPSPPLPSLFLEQEETSP